MNNLVEINNLRKSFAGNDEPSVDGLSLSVAEGSIFGLLGPNGAGKTTTIHILCGLCAADSGEATVCGLSVLTQMKRVRPLIGVVPQEYALYPSLTAEENIRVFGGIYGLSRLDLKSRADELLSAFDLQQSRHKRIEHFSGGMKRRMNLIVALLHRPRMLFLDEPTVGVDVQSRLAIIDNLKSLNRSGTTMIYTSHHLTEAQDLCSDIMLVDHGRCVCQGSLANILSENGASDLEELFVAKTGRKIRD